MIREQEKSCDELNREDQAIVLVLRNAEKQIKDDGLGLWLDEVKQKLFLQKPALQEVWQFFSPRAERELDTRYPKFRRLLSPQQREEYLDRIVLEILAQFLEYMIRTRPTEMIEFTQAEHVVPNSETLDKLIRYESATDRNLSRSIDRLQNLQRQR